MGPKIGPVLTVILLLLIALYSAFYTVDQSEQAILVQLGHPADGTIGPGLHIKIPFIQKVVFFERRLLDYDAPPTEILSADKKNLEIYNYAKWKIADPLVFYTTVRDMSGALLRLGDIIDSEIRMELGRHVMSDIISAPRTDIVDPVKKRSDEWAQNFGVRIVDVRIKRINLPQENQQAVYERMGTERERQAQKYRSEGQEEALKIKAAADRERTVILAEAYRKAQVIRGQGDAEAARIYAAAFQQDPAFFDLVRTLEASRKALDGKTTLVISPDYEFLRFMKKSGAELGPD
ncbi:MAG: protease modulator HflC [Desulfobacterales bacterium]|nr:MAG: protease modulator HflC [Desulfobacterales bacterium]